MSTKPMINDALRLVRLYWGLSQVEMSKALDVSQSLVSDIEGGRKAVSMDMLERYSRALDIRMSKLLFFAEELTNEPIRSRGKLIVAEKILALLERLKPAERVDA